MTDSTLKEEADKSFLDDLPTHVRILVAVSIISSIVIVRTVVFTAGWNWFVTPLGLPAINFAHALGIILLLRYTLLDLSLNPKKAKGWMTVGVAILAPLGVFGIFWVLQGLM